MRVAFDLDMTLVDSRPGIAAALRRTRHELSLPLDVERAVARVGPPIDVVLAEQVPAESLPAAVACFRRHLAELLADATSGAAPVLPGAVEALTAIRERGGSVVVVTAKPGHLAEATLTAAGLPVDVVRGGCYGAAKAAALVETSAEVYVGDQPSDLAAARAAGLPGLAVTSGGVPVEALRAAGAAHVLDSLEAVPELLAAILFPDAALGR